MTVIEIDNGQQLQPIVSNNNRIQSSVSAWSQSFVCLDARLPSLLLSSSILFPPNSRTQQICISIKSGRKKCLKEKDGEHIFIEIFRLRSRCVPLSESATCQTKILRLPLRRGSSTVVIVAKWLRPTSLSARFFLFCPTFGL